MEGRTRTSKCPRAIFRYEWTHARGRFDAGGGDVPADREEDGRRDARRAITRSWRRCLGVLQLGTGAGVYPHWPQRTRVCGAGQSRHDPECGVACAHGRRMASELVTRSQTLVRSGKPADVVAVPGSPLADITATERVALVIQGNLVTERQLTSVSFERRVLAAYPHHLVRKEHHESLLAVRHVDRLRHTAPVCVCASTNPRIDVALLFSHDGCDVFRFFDGGYRYPRALRAMSCRRLGTRAAGRTACGQWRSGDHPTLSCRKQGAPHRWLESARAPARCFFDADDWRP